MKQKLLLSRIDTKAIGEAIARMEKACSSEIRVHIEPKLRGRDIRWVAERTFERLGMTRTRLRNGVLLFVAAEDQQFAILGDQGIDEHVPPNFWNDVVASVADRFKKEQFTEGILEAVERVGSQLCLYFPIQAGDVNELSNEVSFGRADDEDGPRPAPGPRDPQPRQ